MWICVGLLGYKTKTCTQIWYDSASFVGLKISIGCFEATRGYVIYSPRAQPEVNKHISPSGLKITYLFLTWRG